MKKFKAYSVNEYLNFKRYIEHGDSWEWDRNDIFAKFISSSHPGKVD